MAKKSNVKVDWGLGKVKPFKLAKGMLGVAMGAAAIGVAASFLKGGK
jgi:hypothetical protein